MLMRLTILGLAVVLVASSAAGQTAAGGDTEMVYRQQFAAEQFAKLLARMDQVASVMAETDPATAAAIRQAARQAGAAFIAEDMDDVVRLLAAGGLSSADRKQAEVIVHLRHMLRVLRTGEPADEGGALRIERWREMVQRIDRVALRQREHERSSRSPEPDLSPDYAALKAAQDETGEATRQLVRDLEAAPGRSSVAVAAEAMNAASGSLGRERAGEANRQQRAALTALAKARGELLEAVRMAAEHVRAQMLAHLERSLRSMLAAQRQINRETVSISAMQRDGRYGRAEQLKLRALADRQAAQFVAAGKAADQLTDDGTTVVLPAALGDVRQDMSAAADLLGDREAGLPTQSIQQRIVTGLTDLLAVLQNNPSDPGDRKRDSEEGASRPLVDILAELKMLRSMQAQINRQTTEMNAACRGDPLDNEQSRLQHRRLGERQEQIRELTRRLRAKVLTAAHGGSDPDVR